MPGLGIASIDCAGFQAEVSEHREAWRNELDRSLVLASGIRSRLSREAFGHLEECEPCQDFLANASLPAD